MGVAKKRKDLHVARSVSIVVPVYEAPRELKSLLDSMDQSYDALVALKVPFSLWFVNDSPGFQAVRSMMKRHPLFRRPEVRVIENRTNLGFVRSVNRALTLVPAASDVLLLNQDTRIDLETVERMQRGAHADPMIASVSPLTNDGTILSCFQSSQLEGGIPFGIDWKTVSDFVKSRRPRAVVVPVTVGFCMYLKREAIREVGVFDEVFGAGYGEETDWCLRASNLGWSHRALADCFVYHKGSSSFGDQRKRELLEKNLKIISQRYPGYDHRVATFERADPLFSVKAELQIYCASIARSRGNLQMTLHILHSDPHHPMGGTEAHVRDKIRNTLATGATHCAALFPVAAGSALWTYRYYDRKSRRGVGFEIAIHRDVLAVFLSQRLQECSSVEVHHGRDLTAPFREAVIRSKVPKKTFVMHDFSSVCPSIRLVGRDSRFCGLPKKYSDCSHCARTKYGLRSEEISEYEQREFHFLLGFDRIVTPSKNTADVFRSAIQRACSWGALSQAEAAQLTKRIEVREHRLPFGEYIGFKRGRRVNSKRQSKGTVVLLGGLSHDKGSVIAESATGELKRLGFEVVLWGSTDNPNLLTHVKAEAYRSPLELIKLASGIDRPIVVLPGLWPETFMFVLYEALLLVKAPVVVGPFGNPAQVVRERRCGVIMADVTPSELVKAVLRVSQSYSKYARATEQLEKHFARKHASDLKGVGHLLTHQAQSDLNVLDHSKFNSAALSEVIEQSHLARLANGL